MDGFKRAFSDSGTKGYAPPTSFRRIQVLTFRRSWGAEQLFPGPFEPQNGKVFAGPRATRGLPLRRPYLDFGFQILNFRFSIRDI